jgi:PKD repeat protein
VTNASGSDSEIKTGYITVTAPVTPPVFLPTAQFSANITQGQVPLAVKFTDQSITPGSTSYQWDINNDGIVDYTTQNPVHTYTTPGTYTVKLTVTNASGSDSEVKTGYITATSPATPPPSSLTAQFSANITQGQVPLAVKFSSTSVSSGSTSYKWDMNNDGVVDCVTSYPNYTPVYTYKTAGNYTVKLTISNASGSDSEVKTGYIYAALPVSAQFIANGTYEKAPMTVKFTDQSVSPGPTSYQWDINNDGIVDYTAQNPVHRYTTSGTYAVKLTVTNAFGRDTEVKTNYITVLPSTTTETFGAEPNPTGDPIGGGAGYSGIISETDDSVKYVVSSKDQFLNALKTVKSGEVIFVKGTANIDLTGTYGTTIPQGVTLASNRGSGGSQGGRIFQNRLSGDPTTSHSILEVRADTVRITGLRIEGPDKTTASKEGVGPKSGVMLFNTRGFEIDNCEISGFSMTGVGVVITSDSLKSLGLATAKIGRDVAYIHHNYIHHCQADGLGYGITVNGGAELIEANRFDYTRHAIAGAGAPGEGYEAAYNIHLGNTTHNIFDVHPYPDTTPPTSTAIAGDTYKIHHNTFYSSQPTENHVESFDVIIRDVPVHGVWIDHNRMQWNGEFGGSLHPPVAQSGGTGRVYMTRNLIGPEQVLYTTGPVDPQ